jgi:hypothetical protein
MLFLRWGINMTTMMPHYWMSEWWGRPLKEEDDDKRDIPKNKEEVCETKD